MPPVHSTLSKDLEDFRGEGLIETVFNTDCTRGSLIARYETAPA